jgi:hypothetical protein
MYVVGVVVVATPLTNDSRAVPLQTRRRGGQRREPWPDHRWPLPTREEAPSLLPRRRRRRLASSLCRQKQEASPNPAGCDTWVPSSRRCAESFTRHTHDTHTHTHNPCYDKLTTYACVRLPALLPQPSGIGRCRAASAHGLPSGGERLQRFQLHSTRPGAFVAVRIGSHSGASC